MPKGKKFKLHLRGVGGLALCVGLFLVFYSTHVSLPTSKNPYRIYSTEKRDDLKELLKKAIHASQESITLHTYALTDPGILSLLKKKGKEGIPVHLYYHKKTTPHLHLLEEDNMYFHPIEERGLMHEKIWIIDQKLLFLGSANLTSSSLQMHDNLMVGLYCPELAEALSKKRVIEMSASVGNREMRYFSLPNEKALETLITTLDQAKKRVTLALFTFTHPRLTQKLVELHERGVKVCLTLDGTTARGASKNAKEFLENNGVRVKVKKGRELFHHKWANVDNKIFIIGSANWTKAAFNKNRDFILIVNNK